MKNMPPQPQYNEARCHCGQLVAKLHREGVELKCKRCKRIISIPYTNIEQAEVTVQPCSAN